MITVTIYYNYGYNKTAKTFSSRTTDEQSHHSFLLPIRYSVLEQCGSSDDMCFFCLIHSFVQSYCNTLLRLTCSHLPSQILCPACLVWFSLDLSNWIQSHPGKQKTSTVTKVKTMFKGHVTLYAYMITYITHTHKYIHTYTHTDRQTYIYTYIHAYIHTHTHTHTYRQTDRHTYIHTYTHTHPSILIGMGRNYSLQYTLKHTYSIAEKK